MCRIWIIDCESKWEHRGTKWSKEERKRQVKVDEEKEKSEGGNKEKIEWNFDERHREKSKLEI